MELYLDTSDVAAVKKLARIFPLAGVTTNPSIVAAGKNPPGRVAARAARRAGRQGPAVRPGDGEDRRGDGGRRTKAARDNR